MDLLSFSKRFDDIPDRGARRQAVSDYLKEYPFALVFTPPVNEGNYHTQVHESACVPIMIYGMGRAPGGRLTWTARHPYNNNISEVVDAESGYLATHFSVAIGVLRIPTDGTIKAMVIEEISAAQGDFHNRQDVLEAGLSEAQAKVAEAALRVERAVDRMPAVRFQGFLDNLQERVAALEQRPETVAVVEKDPEVAHLRAELAGAGRRVAVLEKRLSDLLDILQAPEAPVEVEPTIAPAPVVAQEPVGPEVWTAEALAELPWPALRKLGNTFGADAKAKKEDILALCLGKPRE